MKTGDRSSAFPISPPRAEARDAEERRRRPRPSGRLPHRGQALHPVAGEVREGAGAEGIGEGDAGGGRVLGGRVPSAKEKGLTMSRSASAGVPEGNSDPRLAAVRASAESWINKLIDLSRRNNLLFFRDLKTGTLDLSGAPPEVLDDLFSGRSVRISQLLGSGDGTRASAQLRSIWDRAVLNREEKGLETLFMARGMATWRPTDGGRPPQAPRSEE